MEVRTRPWTTVTLQVNVSFNNYGHRLLLPHLPACPPERVCRRVPVHREARGSVGAEPLVVDPRGPREGQVLHWGRNDSFREARQFKFNRTSN